MFFLQDIKHSLKIFYPISFGLIQICFVYLTIVSLKQNAMNIIIFLLIGAVSSWIAGQIWKGGGFGLIGNIIVGVVGGFLGGWIMSKLGAGGGGLLWQIIVSVIGAWVLLFLISLVKKK